MQKDEERNHWNYVIHIIWLDLNKKKKVHSILQSPIIPKIKFNYMIIHIEN